MLWKKSVGESRVDCSRVMVLDGRRHFVLKTSDEHMENEGAKYQQTNGVGEMQHTLLNWRSEGLGCSMI